MNNIDAIRRANEQELELGLAGGPGSWHEKYAHSPVVYVGGIPETLLEGELLAIFEQMGQIVHVNLVRHQETKKPRGFAFLAYYDKRSSILAVDNFNGIKVLGSTLCVDHVENYREPDPETTDALYLPVNEPDQSGNSSSRHYDYYDVSDPRKDGVVAANAGGGRKEDQHVKKMMERLAAMRQLRDALAKPTTQDNEESSQFRKRDPEGVSDHVVLEKHHTNESETISKPKSGKFSPEDALEIHRSQLKPERQEPSSSDDDDDQDHCSDQRQERLKRKEMRRKIRDERAARRLKRSK